MDEKGRFTKGDKRCGRKPLGECTRERMIALFTQGKIDKSLVADFDSGNEKVREFVYSHVYGKPVQRNENDTTINLPESIEIKIVK